MGIADLNKSLVAKLVLFHVAVIALANYLVTIKFSLLGFPLTWAAFVFPLIVVATDLTVRLVNKENARTIINWAFIPAIIVSILVVAASGAPWSVAARIGAASGVAYFVSNLLDVYVFQYIRERFSAWYLAPAISTVFANLLDTFTFFGVAFYQSADPFMAANWHVVAANQTITKIVVSLLVVLPTYGVLLSYLEKKLQRTLTGRVPS